LITLTAAETAACVWRVGAHGSLGSTKTTGV
jgi:hypothetical protein